MKILSVGAIIGLALFALCCHAQQFEGVVRSLDAETKKGGKNQKIVAYVRSKLKSKQSGIILNAFEDLSIEKDDLSGLEEYYKKNKNKLDKMSEKDFAVFVEDVIIDSRVSEESAERLEEVAKGAQTASLIPEPKAEEDKNARQILINLVDEKIQVAKEDGNVMNLMDGIYELSDADAKVALREVLESFNLLDDMTSQEFAVALAKEINVDLSKPPYKPEVGDGIPMMEAVTAVESPRMLSSSPVSMSQFAKVSTTDDLKREIEKLQAEGEARMLEPWYSLKRWYWCWDPKKGKIYCCRDPNGGGGYLRPK